MGKNGKQDQIWDDSALINAFNDAISKYMKMHVTGSNNSSADEGIGITSKMEYSSALIDDSNDTGRHVGTNDESQTLTSTENEESRRCTTVPEASNLEQATENPVDSSAGPYIDQEHSGYSFSGSTEGYNQLVNKYYELEDQRQKILQQLKHFGYGNYSSGATTLTSQDLQASSSQACPTSTCSLCPYGCQSWVTPCNSSSCYSLGGTSVLAANNAPVEIASSKNKGSTGDTDFVKTAMVAAERTLTTLKNQAYSNPSENEGKEKQLETDCSVDKSTSSETDLTVVLNAWYSAGFYTGKYLSEQSFASSQRP